MLSFIVDYRCILNETVYSYPTEPSACTKLNLLLLFFIFFIVQRYFTCIMKFMIIQPIINKLNLMESYESHRWQFIRILDPLCSHEREYIFALIKINMNDSYPIGLWRKNEELRNFEVVSD